MSFGVKVLSYNVYMRDQLPGLSHGAKVRAPLIANLIARSDYDVVTFQEAFDDGARDEIVKILKRDGQFAYRTWVVGNDDDIPQFSSPLRAIIVVPFLIGFGIFEGRLPRSDGGIFIMSRWPIVLQGQIVYRRATGIDEFGKKGVSWAMIDKQGSYFNIFTTHTQANAKGVRHDEIRAAQFQEFRTMVDSVGLLWQPAIFTGDMNVDYCFDGDRQRGACSSAERVAMLRLLRCGVPRDLARYSFTSDPRNELKPDNETATTLDYTLYSTTHQAPVHSSMETVPLRSPWRVGKSPHSRQDLSDHYAVCGNFTFPTKREESSQFRGSWKRIQLNGSPDPADLHLTISPFGINVESSHPSFPTGRIVDIQPSAVNKGRVVFENRGNKTREEWHYTFNQNDGFRQYFTPGQIPFQRKPPLINELFLRNPRATQLFAFESHLPIEWPPERPISS